MIALLLELRAAGVGWVSAALGAELLPFVLFASLSGRIADRIDNRRLVVLGLAGQALVAVPLAFARHPWLVVTLFFALNAVSTVVRPAANAVVPALVGEEGAKSAYATIATGTSLGWIIGPGVGGLLTAAFGVTATIATDAATFAAMAVACSLLSATRIPMRAKHAEKPHGGMRIVRRDRILFWSITTTSIAVACAVVDNVAAPFRFVEQLATSSSGYGFYLTVWGLGALVGSQIPRRVDASLMPAVLAVGNGVSGLGIVGIGVAPSLAVAYIASFVGGIGNGIATVSVNALTADRVTEAERGRAFATVGAMIQTGVGVGTVAGAPLTAALGAGHAMITAGALAAVVSAAVVGGTLRARPR